MPLSRGRKPLPSARRLRFIKVGLYLDSILTIKELTGQDNLSAAVRDCVMIGMTVLKTTRTPSTQAEENNNGK